MRLPHLGCIARLVRIACVWALTLTVTHASGEEMIVALRVNGQARGDVLIDTQSNGSVHIGPQDTAKLGFLPERLAAITPKGEITILTDKADLGVKLNMETLSLDITATPEWFARNVLSLSTRSSVAISELQGIHGWLNYSLATQVAHGARPSATLETAAFVSRGAWTLHSDQNAAFRDSGNTINRTQTNLTYDDIPHLARLSIGDIAPAVGTGSTTAKLIGVQWARRFEFDPATSAQPTFNWSGQVRTPSTVDILVDGVRVKTFSVGPGPFDLRELAYFGGLRNVEVVIRDRAGAETRLNVPYYFASELLASGRDSFDVAGGVADSAASTRQWSFSGQYRRGLTDNVTLGAATEAKASYQSARIDTGIRHEWIGTLLATAAASKSRGDSTRFAATAAHNWSSGRLASQVNAAWQARGFGVDGEASSTARMLMRRVAASGSFSFDSQRSASINFSRSTFAAGAPEGIVSLRAAQGWGRGGNVWASISRIQQDGHRTTAASVGLSVPLGQYWSVSSSYAAQSGEVSAISLRASRADAGDGWSDLRIAAEHRGDSTMLDTFVQRPMSYGMMALSARAEQRGGTSDLSAEARFSGALAWAERQFWLSPPIAQAFAIVDAAGVAGVRVMHNNQLAGLTNEGGKLLIPNLAAYASNQVRIDDRDIPMEIELNAVQQEVAPRLYAGAKVEFAGKRVSAVAGILQIAATGSTDSVPLAAAQITATSGATSTVSSTDSEGGFYLENLKPGQWMIAAVNRKIRCTATIVVSDSSPSFVDMGRVPCFPQ